VGKQASRTGEVNTAPRQEDRGDAAWFDAVVVNHAVRINGIREITITKLDVLNDFDKIKICIGYRRRRKNAPARPFEHRTVEEVPACL